MLIGLNNNEIVKHNQNTGYEIDAFPGDEKVSAGTHDKFRVNNDDKMKSNSANVIEEEKRDDDANYNSQQAKRFTDPTSSY